MDGQKFFGTNRFYSRTLCCQSKGDFYSKIYSTWSCRNIKTWVLLRIPQKIRFLLFFQIEEKAIANGGSNMESANNRSITSPPGAKDLNHSSSTNSSPVSSPSGGQFHNESSKKPLHIKSGSNIQVSAIF